MDSKIIQLAKQSGYDAAALLAFIEVETGGKGFDAATGKILIQFEPSWFKKIAKNELLRYNSLKSKLAVNEKITTVEQTFIHNWEFVTGNKVSVQILEWQAFNIAFAINPNAAMQSTSIGLGQIMGFHWKRLGYTSVGAMWDDAKKGIEFQVKQLIKFISTDARLQKAIKLNDWSTVASIYNGAGYKELAKRIGREPYDISMAKAFDKYSKLLQNNN